MRFNELTAGVRLHFRAAFVGLAAAILASPLLVFIAVSASAPSVPVQPVLSSWSNERVLGELGEASQVGECPVQEGLVGRLWVDEGNRRIVLVCTPSR